MSEKLGLDRLVEVNWQQRFPNTVMEEGVNSLAPQTHADTQPPTDQFRFSFRCEKGQHQKNRPTLHPVSPRHLF